MHDRMDEVHAVVVSAHSIRAHDKAGEAVGAFANCPHGSIGLGADYRRALGNRLRTRRERLSGVLLVGELR